MFTVTRTATRASTDIPFYVWPEGIVAYVEEAYTATGKRQAIITLSEDELTETRVNIFPSLLESLEFSNDPSLVEHWANRDAYQELHGMIVTRVEEES